jgi:hypothetical protein
MSIGLSKMKGIIEALTALARENPPAKKTRSGAAFALGQAGEGDSKTVKHLRICGGWPDWEADFDYSWEANKAQRMQEAVWLQEQLGAGIGMCAELESLHLENMEWYVHKNKKGVKLFFVNLRNCDKLTKLALINNTCGGCFLDVIIPEVLQLPLRELDLRGNRLFREDRFPEEGENEARETAFVELLGTLGECKTLVHLSLADMNLEFQTTKGRTREDQTTRCVLRLMQELPLLKALRLSDNEMTPQAKLRLQQKKPAMLEITF